MKTTTAKQYMDSYIEFETTPILKFVYGMSREIIDFVDKYRKQNNMFRLTSNRHYNPSTAECDSIFLEFPLAISSNGSIYTNYVRSTRICECVKYNNGFVHVCWRGVPNLIKKVELLFIDKTLVNEFMKVSGLEVAWIEYMIKNNR